MNPLDLTGPEFLRFYIPYGLCILAIASVVRVLLGRASGAPSSMRWLPGAYPREGDAYAIALLRGGRTEAAQTLLARLVGAGLLHVVGRQVHAALDAEERVAQLQRAEATAWSAVERQLPLDAMEARQRLEHALSPTFQEIEDELAREGLMPDQEKKKAYWALTTAAWLAVGGLGLAKLAVAISRGRWNIGFLILLLVGFTLLILLLRPPVRMPAARKYLDWLQESHRGLVNMLESGRRDSVGEMALAAGIYGVAAVPALVALGTAVQPVPDRRQEGDGSSSGSGCGSGCGSGGSSCGGGCGGGGCGGCGG